MTAVTTTLFLRGFNLSPVFSLYKYNYSQPPAALNSRLKETRFSWSDGHTHVHVTWGTLWGSLGYVLRRYTVSALQSTDTAQRATNRQQTVKQLKTLIEQRTDNKQPSSLLCRTVYLTSSEVENTNKAKVQGVSRKRYFRRKGLLLREEHKK